jgi:hypothetical protein
MGNQIDILTPTPSFGHNLCFKYSNGTWEPILDIYFPIDFQWYKKFFNPMNFDLCNCSLKIQESIGTPIPKVGTHLGVCGFIPSHPPTLLRVWNVIRGLHSWPTPLQALALVASPRLGLRQYMWQLFLQANFHHIALFKATPWLIRLLIWWMHNAFH